ncbi:mannan endo-1,4-beta-mannosidase 5-like [Gastrolobium bilobum]|uniref:mannan endo-1,4-beta-mannosidase 5-like n=1 Tax=Gastrolobium bilobum TaxID=150636 RepID=UPI002AB1F461|nr:mannan endo-1,4-beta-mannosidase 5-like [Gastrolobium bilobum]
MTVFMNLTSVIVLLISTLVCEARLLNDTAGFVQSNGTEFVLNGSPFLFNGFNSYWMMNVAADPNQTYKVSNVFRDASAAGLTVCRTWAFSDGGNQSLQISPGLYNEPMFQALDFVVAEAKKYGVRLILSLVNNYKDFGGRPQYVQWANSSGVPVNNDDDFYNNTVIKDYYKAHVKTVLTRNNTITGTAYRDEPTIMAWELINEPRCEVDYSGMTINAWVQEMAPYVKSIDNNHLLEVGMEGFYGDSIPEKKQYNPGFQVGTDFVSNNLIEEIDFTTIHAYPDNWLAGQNDTVQMAFMQSWMTSHWNDSSTILKKPLVLTEFGMSNKDDGYSIDARDSFMNAVYSSIYDLAQHGGTFAGGLIWQLLDEGMDPYDDGYEIVLSQNSSTNSVISQQSSKMIALEHSLGI